MKKIDVAQTLRILANVGVIASIVIAVGRALAPRRAALAKAGATE